MSISLEKIDSYIRTFIDFLILRPRNFLSKREKSSVDLYMSPGQFLFFSISLILIISTAKSTIVSQLRSDKAYQIDAKSLSVISAILIMFGQILLTFCLYIIARLPPTRKHPSFHSIFELSCFMFSFQVIYSATDGVIAVIIYYLTVAKIIPEFYYFVSLFFLSAISFFLTYAYNLIGLAQLCDVTIRRIFLSFLSFVLLIAIVVSLFSFIYHLYIHGWPR